MPSWYYHNDHGYRTQTKTSIFKSQQTWSHQAYEYLPKSERPVIGVLGKLKEARDKERRLGLRQKKRDALYYSARTCCMVEGCEEGSIFTLTEMKIPLCYGHMHVWLYATSIKEK